MHWFFCISMHTAVGTSWVEGPGELATPRGVCREYAEFVQSCCEGCGVLGDATSERAPRADECNPLHLGTSFPGGIDLTESATALMVSFAFGKYR